MILCKPWLLGLFICQVVNSKPHMVPNGYNNYDYYYGYDSLYDDTLVYDTKISDASTRVHSDYGYDSLYYDNAVYDTEISDASTRVRSDSIQAIIDGSTTIIDGSTRVRSDYTPEISDTVKHCLRELENDTLEFIQPDTLKNVAVGDIGHPLGVPYFGYLTPIPDTPLAPVPEISPIFTKGKYFQGDIIFRSKEEYCRALSPDSFGLSSSSSSSSSSIHDESVPHSPSVQNFDGTKWPNAEIPIRIGIFSQKERTVIESAINEIKKKTCLKFPNYQTQNEYVHIIKGEPDDCKSFIGYVKDSSNEMVLGDGCFEVGVVVHELMHAAGFYHTHSRRDRDRHIEIHEEHIKEHINNTYINQIKQKMTSVMITLNIPYDIRSVLHYPSNSFQNEFAELNNKSTITEKGNEKEKILQKQVLSELDVEGLIKLYNCQLATCNDLSCPLNGKCVEGNVTRAATCVCDNGYRMEGNDCIATCDSLSCLNGRCREGNGIVSATCGCDDGYRMERNYCIATCSVLSCSRNERCEEGNGTRGATCVCNGGYRAQGTYCLATCRVHNCSRNERCEEGNGTRGATCVCNDGYRDQGTDCLATCNALSCPRNGSCEEGCGWKDATCVCNNGYRLDGNECRATCNALSCPHNGKCEEGSGRKDATCVCKNGYRLDGNECRVTCMVLSCKHDEICYEGFGTKDATCVCNPAIGGSLGGYLPPREC